MRVGKLDKRIDILEKKQEPDGAGGFKKPDWIKIGKVWAGFERPRFKEEVIQGSKAGLITQGIKIRRTKVNRNWHIGYDDQEYEILHVDDSVVGETMLTTREVIK
jgi:SPP1 family predicted phage head-tail adaptor